MKTQPRVRRILSALLVIVIMTMVFYFTRSRPADSLFIDGTIHTLDPSNRTVQALAVADGRIIDVGTTGELRSRYDADTTINLQGRAVIPGFVDAHGRLLNAGILALTLDLSQAGSAREAALLVGRHAAAIPMGTWIRGRGWKNIWWEQERDQPLRILDEAAPSHPAFLVGEDGETAWVNTLALEQAGFSRHRTEHEPATIVRDRDGNAIGILLDDASALVGESMPPPTDWELNAALDSAVAACLRAGITTIHDFGVTEREIALYQTRIAYGTLPLRIYAVIGGPGETWDAYRQSGPLIGGGDNGLSVAALELYVDGALESRSAALLESYADDPTTRGLTFADEEQLAATTGVALESGFQVCLNARGDRAVRIALNAVTEALGPGRAAAGKIRLEGVQLIRPEDLARAKDLGITLSLQPTQYLLDFDIAVQRLGPERMRGFLPWHEALSTGCALAGGTDLPIGPADPFVGIALVLTRNVRQNDAPQMAGREADELRLSALRMFTTWSAQAGGEEHEKGSLEAGKLADFLVLSDDPLVVAPRDLVRIRIEATVLGGRVVSTSNAR